MSKTLLCPSIMCANFEKLSDEIINLDEAGDDIFHVDIMDGSYVHNLGLVLQKLEVSRKTTDMLVDVHLMIQEPSKYIKKFADMGVDIIYFHPDADLHPTRTIDLIKNKKISAGIAINPGTSLSSVRE